MIAVIIRQPACQKPPEPQWTHHSTLPRAGALLTAPKMARGFVADTLGHWGLSDWEENAVLIVSELVTNVVRRAYDENGHLVYPGDNLPTFQLSLFTDHKQLMIVVWDDAPGWPVEKHVDGEAETGRGLEMIGKLGGWTWEQVDNGKIVRAFPFLPTAAA